MLADVAGSTLAAYILMGMPATHLLSASVLSAPAAIAIAKLLHPETETGKAKAVLARIEARKRQRHRERYGLGLEDGIDMTEIPSPMMSPMPSGSASSLRIVASTRVPLSRADRGR